MNEKLKHTQGKLYVSAVGVGFEIESENGTCIAQAQQISAFDQMSGSFERKTNARRLTACWNACEGMGAKSIEELSTIGGVPSLIVYGDDVRRERNELLDALKVATDALAGGLWDFGSGQDEHEKCNEVIAQCRVVIAKATGKTSEAA